MSDVVLGKAPTDNAERDAIHVAVVPMVASENLHPAQRVGVVADGIAGPTDKIVGIVDPYLTGVVVKDTSFWLCLLPGTVTGMRHHWSHQAFSDALSQGDDTEKSKSEQWLREYAKRANPYDSESDAFERLLSGLRLGELYFYGSDLHGLYDVDDAEELKRHAEVYLGIQIDYSRFSFSCSC